jgi:DNA-directed RNA polymerase subunit M/transcription elongation factor TFIIS
MKKCYHKEYSHTIPALYCDMCKNRLYPGDSVYSVILTWGSGKYVCKKCYNEYEIDWSMHEDEYEDD